MSMKLIKNARIYRMDLPQAGALRMDIWRRGKEA